MVRNHTQAFQPVQVIHGLQIQVEVREDGTSHRKNIAEVFIPSVIQEPLWPDNYFTKVCLGLNQTLKPKTHLNIIPKYLTIYPLNRCE